MSKTNKLVLVLPEERETHLCLNKKLELAVLTTFDELLKRKAVRAGGQVKLEGKTKPPYWIIEVPEKLVRIGFKSEAKALAMKARAEARKEAGLDPIPNRPRRAPVRGDAPAGRLVEAGQAEGQAVHPAKPQL